MREHYADKYSDLSDIATTVLAENAKDIGTVAFKLAEPAAQQMTDNERGITKLIRKLQRQARGVLQANARDIGTFLNAAGDVAKFDVYLCDAIDGVGNRALICLYVPAGELPGDCHNPTFVGRMDEQAAEAYCTEFAARAQAPRPAGVLPAAPLSSPLPGAPPAPPFPPAPGPPGNVLPSGGFSVWYIP